MLKAVALSVDLPGMEEDEKALSGCERGVGTW